MNRKKREKKMSGQHRRGHLSEERRIIVKRSCQPEWKCKMFSGVVSSGFIIGVLSYEHFDNVT